MKTFFLIGILFLSSLDTFSQNKGLYYSDNNEKSNTTISVGINVIDNNNRVVGNIIPFIGVRLDFKSPFFVIVEHRFDSDFSSCLSLTTNQLTTKTDRFLYAAVDVNGQFYFEDYIFNSDDIETYVGIGLGHYYFDKKENNTFNFLGGIRYWYSDHYAISTQLIGKIGLPPVNTDVYNNYQFNLGLVWRN